MILTESATLNYSDVFYSFFTNNDSICHDKAKFHYLVYVYSGEMLLVENGKEISVRSGQCIFIRRDHRVQFTKHPVGEESFKSISLVFKRNFLRKYYQKFQTKNPVEDIEPLQSSVIKLPETAGLESLFLSMKPYFETAQEPQQELIDLKMQEGVLSLLAINKAFFPTLFDFTEPWKIDILDFLNENYMYDLTMEEIASYTGRSLATFKRDFKKISDLSPQKWLIKKRLEKAHEMIKANKSRITDVCYEVGFKNRSHFTTAFKKYYGYPPTSKN
ncbi:MAG: AraC family transcriptional regulator [Candidatus Azobacteroides sp.]|nr:AraC family transcriptional regulator [Candidatus Azobacteroides sp.]